MNKILPWLKAHSKEIEILYWKSVGVFLFPFLIFIGLLWLPLPSIKIHKAIVQYNDGQFICYKAVEGALGTESSGTMPVDATFLTDFLKIPKNLIEYEWCAENKSWLSLDYQGSKNILRDFGFIVLSGNENKYEFSCPDSDQYFKEGCAPMNINQLGSGSFLVGFSYQLQHICPTDYLSDLEARGRQKPGEFAIYVQLKMRNRLLIALVGFFVSSSLWWGWISLFKKAWNKNN